MFVNSEIDRQEFKKVMALMRSQNRQGANHRDGRRLRIKASVENGGLLEYFFGKHGNSCLQHERFVQFLRELHDEVCEFTICYFAVFGMFHCCRKCWSGKCG